MWVLAALVEIVCALTEPDVIVVDGMLDDWQGVKAFEVGSGRGDADVRFRCNYDPTYLYVSLDVVDDRLIRTAKAGPGEDHVVLAFGGAKVVLYPAQLEYHAKRKLIASGLGKVEAADSLQPKGWSVELAVPLRKIPGWGKGVPTLPFRFEVRDADAFVEKRIQDVVGLSADTGRLSFAEGAQLFRDFLSQLRLKRADVRLDTLAEMDGEVGLERVIWAGRVIAVLSDQYAVVELAVPPQDVLEVKVVDLSGGKKSVLARWVERGNGGSREVLAVFNLKRGGALQRTFAHEIAKQVGPNRLTNLWTIEPTAELNKPPRGKPRKGPKKPKLPGKNAIVIRIGEVVGFSAATWRELPAEDMRPILLPWGEVKEEVWAFQGDEVFGGTLSHSGVHPRWE
jgi:hypothetical protein